MEENRKPNPLKTIITVSVSLAIAGLFMWFALKGMEFEKIAGYFAKANYFWVFAAALFGILAYWFRAVRWNLLLEPMGYNISNSNALWTIYFRIFDEPYHSQKRRARPFYSAFRS